MKVIKLIQTDSRGFDALADQAELILVSFSRKNVEKCATGDAVERLMLLSDSPVYTRKFMGRISFVFEGYDHDSRDIQQIPECVRFFRELTKTWPYWLHFVSKDDQTLGMLFSMVFDNKLVSKGGGYSSYEITNPHQLSDAMKHLFNAMNALHDLHGVEEAVNYRISTEVNDRLMRYVGGGSREHPLDRG